jgi:dTDP-4-dehydrorhamnose reductase
LRLLLTGRSGQVGGALERLLAPRGDLVALDRAALDLADAAAVGRAVAEAKPDVIVNAAAYTAVDRAERDADAAFAVNARAPAALAKAAAARDALLVHFSTDYVFDGAKGMPYVESDPTAPLNVYGRSKLEGEQAIAASGCRHYVFRTSWVYAPRGKNFVHTILAAAKAKPELRVVNDQHGAPTTGAMLAGAVAAILGDAALRARPSGVYHLTAAGETTWYGFATEILRRAGLATPVLPVPSSDYPTPARRPANSRLDNAKARAAFGFALPDWRAGLDDFMRAIA